MDLEELFLWCVNDLSKWAKFSGFSFFFFYIINGSYSKCTKGFITTFWPGYNYVWSELPSIYSWQYIFRIYMAWSYSWYRYLLPYLSFQHWDSILLPFSTFIDLTPHERFTYQVEGSEHWSQIKPVLETPLGHSESLWPCAIASTLLSPWICWFPLIFLHHFRKMQASKGQSWLWRMTDHVHLSPVPSWQVRRSSTVTPSSVDETALGVRSWTETLGSVPTPGPHLFSC